VELCAGVAAAACAAQSFAVVERRSADLERPVVRVELSQRLIEVLLELVVRGDEPAAARRDPTT
jgi:hypothetical protein